MALLSSNARAVGDKSVNKWFQGNKIIAIRGMYEVLLLVTQEAVTSMPVVGFSVGTQKVLLLGGEVLRTDIFFLFNKM